MMEMKTMNHHYNIFEKRYSEVIMLQTFEERFDYLKVIGQDVGYDTFGYDRYLNQTFYKSQEWKRVRDFVIVRDNGCDLGIPGRDIGGRIYIHHINPITKEDIIPKNIAIAITVKTNDFFLLSSVIYLYNCKYRIIFLDKIANLTKMQAKKLIFRLLLQIIEIHRYYTISTFQKQ